MLGTVLGNWELSVGKTTFFHSVSLHSNGENKAITEQMKKIHQFWISSLRNKTGGKDCEQWKRYMGCYLYGGHCSNRE
jgi:thiamine kinase-like enzyme